MLDRKYNKVRVDKKLTLGKGASLVATSAAGVETVVDMTELAALNDIAAADLAKIDGITNGTAAAGKALVLDANKDIGTIRHLTISGNFVTGSTTLSEAELGVLDSATAGTAAAGKAVVSDSNYASAVGAINPATGLACTVQKIGAMVQLDFTLTAVELTVTDAAGSGSSASLKIFDFVQAGIQPIASRQNYTAFAEGAALTGAVGDAAFVMALGSAAADAGDGALTGTEVDFAPATGTITLSGGTGTGTKFGGQGTAVDGTATAADLYLNWSGTAATIDANSTIAVTGTITLLVALLGDD